MIPEEGKTKACFIRWINVVCYHLINHLYWNWPGYLRK